MYKMSKTLKSWSCKEDEPHITGKKLTAGSKGISLPRSGYLKHLESGISCILVHSSMPDRTREEGGPQLCAFRPVFVAGLNIND